VRKTALCAAFVLAAAASASDLKGIAVRASRTAYPITCFTEKIAVGAALMPAGHVRDLFGPEVEKRYLVVEVGVFPKLGNIDVKHADFGLRLVTPQVVAKPANPSLVSPSAMNKVLPEAATARPLAGYLFFPLPNPAVPTHYELDYTGYGEWLTLPLTQKK
jgi:hypothetical protein